MNAYSHLVNYVFEPLFISMSLELFNSGFWVRLIPKYSCWYSWPWFHCCWWVSLDIMPVSALRTPQQMRYGQFVNWVWHWLPFPAILSQSSRFLNFLTPLFELQTFKWEDYISWQRKIHEAKASSAALKASIVAMKGEQKPSLSKCKLFSSKSPIEEEPPIVKDNIYDKGVFRNLYEVLVPLSERASFFSNKSEWGSLALVLYSSNSSLLL